MPTSFSDRLHHFHITVPGAHISPQAVLAAGFISGAFILILEMLTAPTLLGMSIWVPARMAAAITMGRSVLPPPATYDLSVVLPSIIIHFALSLAYATIFAFIAKGRSMRMDALLGAGFGLVLYVVNYHGFTFFFPWFAYLREWATVFTQVVYGIVLGATYAFFAKRNPSRARW